MAQVLNATKERHDLDPRDVDDVVVGCVTAYGEQAMCIARMSVLAAEWPNDSTGVTINRFCGSGQQAVNFAAMGIKSGEQDLVVAGGVESMSRVPMNADRGGIDGHNRHLRQLHPLVQQGISGDLIATREGFSREDCDSFALSSQQRYARAHTEGPPEKEPDSGAQCRRHAGPGTRRISATKHDALRGWVNCRRPLRNWASMCKRATR